MSDLKTDFLEWAVKVLVTEFNWKESDAREWIIKTNYYPYPVSYRRFLSGD